MEMEGLHLLADVAIADYQLYMITHRNQDFGYLNDDDSTKKKHKQQTRFPDVLVSEPSLKGRNRCPLDQEEAYKFSDMNLLADVAAAASSSLLDDWDYNTTYTTKKNKKQKKPRPKPSDNATSWSLQVNNSNLKLCFKKNNGTLVPSTQTSSNLSFPRHPIDLLAQVAFAYKTSTLWALCANTIPTKRRSTYSRRPDRRFKHVPTTPIAGTKRGFVDKEAEECQSRNSSNKRRRVTQSLPVQLSNYLATKNAVGDPKLVIIKQLYDTDLNPHQCRFSIPLNQVIDGDFLTPEDRRRLDNRETIDVTLIQPCLEEKPMHLKKWMMNGTGIYVLNKGWSSVIRNNENRLHLNSTVELWSFTCNKAPYFALSTRDDDIHTAMSAGSGRKDNSGDFNGDIQPTSDDESTITIQEDV